MHIIRGPRTARILKDQQRHLFKRLLHSSLGRQPLQSWGIRQRRFSSKFRPTPADKDPRICMSSLLLSTSGPVFTSSASDYLIRHSSATALQPYLEPEPPISKTQKNRIRYLRRRQRLPTQLVWCSFLKDELEKIRAETDDPFRIAERLGRKVYMAEIRGTRADPRSATKLLNGLIEVARGIDIFQVKLELDSLLPIAKELAKVSVVLKRLTWNPQVAHELTAKAGEEILRLVRRPENDGEIQPLVLIGIGQALTGNLVSALATMGEVIDIARPAILKAVQQPTGLDPEHDPHAEPLSNLLQAVIDCSIESALGERHTRLTRFPSRRYWFLREEMQRIRNNLESGSYSDEVMDASTKLKRFTRNLLLRSLILPFASRAHRLAQSAFDDLISSFTNSDIQDLIRSSLKLRPAVREQGLLAIGFSLLRLGRNYEAFSLYVTSDENGIKLSERFAKRLIRAYQREGHMATLRKIMDILQRQSVDPTTGIVNLEESTYTVLASIFAMRGQVLKLCRLWQRYIEQHPKPDSSLLKHTLLEAYGRSKNLDLFEEHLHKYWILPDSSELPDGKKMPFRGLTFWTVIDTYASQGRTEDAERYLELLKTSRFSRDKHILPAHNVVLRRYLRNHDLTKAGHFWSSMLKNGPKPSSFTYELMIKLFTHRGDLRTAFDFLDLMQDEGYKPSTKLLSHLMLQLIRAGEYKQAESMFRSLMTNSPHLVDVRMYNCMLESLIRRNSPWTTVFSMFEDMKRKGIPPDERTYTMLIISASEADLIETAEHYFTIADKSGAKPKDTQQSSLTSQKSKPDSPKGGQKGRKTASSPFPSAQATVPPTQPRFLKLAPDQRTNLHHFSILIHLHLRRRNMTAAKEYFEELQRRRVQIPALTWSILVKAYVDRGTEVNIQMARDIILSQLGGSSDDKATAQEEGVEGATAQEEDEGATAQEEDEGATAQEEEEGATAQEEEEGLTAQEEGALPQEKGATQHRKKHRQTVQILYAPLLAHSAKKGDSEGVNDILAEFERRGASFSFSTLCNVMDCYRQNDDLPKMVQIWNRIFAMATAPVSGSDVDGLLNTASALQEQRSSGERPTAKRSDAISLPRRLDIETRSVRRNSLCVPLSIMLSALLRQNRHADIAKLWTDVRSIGFSFDPNNWNQLARALASAGRVEDALKVLQNVLNQQMPAKEIRRLLVKGDTRSGHGDAKFGSSDTTDRITVPSRSNRRIFQRKRSWQQRFYGDIFPKEWVDEEGAQYGGRENDRGLRAYDRWLRQRLLQAAEAEENYMAAEEDGEGREVLRIFDQQNILDMKRPYWYARPSTLANINRALGRYKNRYRWGDETYAPEQGFPQRGPRRYPSDHGNVDDDNMNNNNDDYYAAREDGRDVDEYGDGRDLDPNGEADPYGGEREREREGHEEEEGFPEDPQPLPPPPPPLEHPVELLNRYPRAAQILETYMLTRGREAHRRLQARRLASLERVKKVRGMI